MHCPSFACVDSPPQVLARFVQSSRMEKMLVPAGNHPAHLTALFLVEFIGAHV